MWESILQLLEKLIPQIPSREDLSRGFDGLMNSLPRWIRQPDRPPMIEPLSQQQRDEASVRVTPIQQVEASLQKSQEGLSRLQRMLDGLGKKEQAVESRDTGPAHVIVDNAKDIRPIEKPQPDKPTAPAVSPIEKLQNTFNSLRGMQSPEWQQMSESERSKRMAQRFQAPATPQTSAWDRLIQRAVAITTSRRNQQQLPIQPPTRASQAYQARQPKTMGQRLSTLFRWKTRPQKLVNWGRKLQLGAGRIMAAGGGSPIVNRVASGMSRLGLALEGLGTARIAGAAAGIAGLTAAVVAAPVALLSFVRGAKAAGDNLLAEQQRLAPFGMNQARAAMVTTVSQQRTDIAMARDTGQQTLKLARAMGDLRRELQPIEGALKNLELKTTTWGAELATAIAANAKELVAMPGNLWDAFEKQLVEDGVALVLGGWDAVKEARDRREREAKAAAAPQPQQIVMPAQDFIRGLKQAAGNGLGQRKPLDPIR